MNEYAPVYTTRERIVNALKLMAWILPFYLVAELWFFDWLADYSRNANCYNYGNINGVHLIFYGIFFLMPLLFAVVLLLIEGKRSIKILKLGQNPLPNEKVLVPTKYKYGSAAKVQPFVFFSVIIFIIGLSIWGGFQAYELTKDIKPCSVNKSLNQIGTK